MKMKMQLFPLSLHEIVLKRYASMPMLVSSLIRSPPMLPPSICGKQPIITDKQTHSHKPLERECSCCHFVRYKSGNMSPRQKPSSTSVKTPRSLKRLLHSAHLNILPHR